MSGAPRTRVYSTEDMQGSAGGRLHRGLPRGPGLGTPGGAARCHCLSHVSHLSARFPAPPFPYSRIPVPSLPSATPPSEYETKLNALVTVLKKIQSREPSGWRTAERRRGWRCRGYGGGRGRGGVRVQLASPGRGPRCPLLSSWGSWVLALRGRALPRCPGSAPVGPRVTRRGRPLRPAAAPGKPCLCSGSQGLGLEGSLGMLRAEKALWFLLPHTSPCPPLFPGTSEVAGRWEGRRACRLCRLGSRSSGAGGVRVRTEARDGRSWGERDGTGEDPGAGQATVPSPPSGAGDLFPGEPPPSRSQPREQRVWEARSGSGSGGGGRQEGRQWG